ncbi:hypothetical protein BAE44_0008844, partial [Dichanthelium oligosanthes]
LVLELSGYQGSTMLCSARGFSRLQKLALYYFNSHEWRMPVGAMPRLSQLKLYRCRNMKKLPEGLLHRPSLKVGNRFPPLLPLVIFFLL